MKILLLILSIGVIQWSMVIAQSPLSIPYQAVARDSSGNFISNQIISLRFSIHDVTANGSIVYQETQTDTTNALGLFIANIGEGNINTGTFAAIDWGNGAKFIQVEMDASGGSTYTSMGTQQMLSVPYALFAGNAGNNSLWNANGADIINSNAGSVGVGTATPAASAILDASSSTKGFLIPRMNTVQRNAIASPATGLQIFNTDNQCIDIYDGANWIMTCGLKVNGPIIDPGHTTTNSWTQKSSIGFGRSGAVAFTIGDKGYIGTGGGSTLLLNDFWEFDPIANSWTQKANFSGGSRRDAVGFSIGNKGYIGTGNLGMNNTNDFWEFDPIANTWTQKASIDSTSRSCAVGFNIGNKGYVGIGNDGTSDLNDFFEYDPTTDTWTEMANYPGGGRKFTFAAGINARGYLGLGTDANGNYHNDVWEFDPAINVWLQKGTFPGSGFHSMACFTMNNKGYMGTGFNGATNITDFYEYNPSTDVWTTKATFSGLARKQAVGFSIGPKGYIVTGDNGPVQLNDVWEYMDDNVTGTAFSSNTNPSTDLVSDGAWTLYNNKVYNSNSGNVGVGTSSPSNKFSVVGNADFEGNVGIGTTSPANKLSVVGNVNINGNLVLGTSSPTAQLHTTGSVRLENLSGAGFRPVYTDSLGNLSSSQIPTLASSNNTTQNIPDFSCTGISSQITLSGYSTTIPSGKISIKVNVTHNYVSDLNIYLQAPDGSILNLLYGNGASGHNLIDTYFSDEGPMILPNNLTEQPFTNTYRPTGSPYALCGIVPSVTTFSAIGGGAINPNGTWILRIVDQAQGDAGSLNNWSISINNLPIGVTNYLPKWKSGVLTASSLIYDNGTNVGIGTKFPNNQLSVLGTADINGKLGIENADPHAPLQFSNVTANRKIVLFEDANNDHYFYGFGVEPGALRYQAGNSGGIFGGDHVFYSGTNWGGVSSNEILRLKGNGYVGIGTSTPHAALQLANYDNNRKIVLNEVADNDHQFYGFGFNSAAMRYQIGSTTASHIFYSGNGTSASNELMRIQGNGRVGIGTATVSDKLSISNADASITTVTIASPGKGTQQSHIHYGTYGDWYIRPATTPGNIYLSDMYSSDYLGSVGIGTTFLPYKFTVNGNAAKNGSSTWIVTSDKRLKQNISPYSNGLSELLKISPVWFNYNEKSGYDTSKRYVGVLAQELKEIAPYMVDEFSFNRQDPSAEKYLSVDNGAMTYMLINSVKEQQQQIEELKKQNAEQQIQNQELLKRIVRLENK